MQIISRKEARAAGLVRYFTGLPCPHGHLAERRVKGATCCECAKTNNKSGYATPQGKHVKKVSFLKRQYGLTIEEVDNMRASQGYCCAICSTPENETPKQVLFIDHEHVTGNVRALLCRDCNTALGLVHERIDVLKAMISYLEIHK
jgi:Recombination endonuclease VII